MNTFTKEDRFRILKDFWGYGNPATARVLFIGIEEANDWSSPKLKTHKCGARASFSDIQVVDWLIGAMQKKYMTFEDWGTPDPDCPYLAKSPTERMQAYLARKLNPITATDSLMTPKRYIEEGLFLKEREFQANIFPVGCRGDKKWNPETCQWFLLPESKNQYRKDVIDWRAGVLKELIDEITSKVGKRPIIFVMGKTRIWTSPCVWKKVEPIFGVGSFIECAGLPSFHHSNDFSVWLTPHPSCGGISYGQADKIVNCINIYAKLEGRD